MNFGDIEFPQYDENGTEIFRQSSNDACSRCCVTRSKSAVDKAGSQDLSGFALATATGALKDKTKISLFFPKFAFDFKNINNLKQIIENLKKKRRREGKEDGFLNYEDFLEPVYETFQDSKSNNEKALELLKASFLLQIKMTLFKLFLIFHLKKKYLNLN